MDQLFSGRRLATQIKRLVGVGFAVLFLLLLAVVAIALLYLDQSNRLLEQVVGSQNVKSALAANMGDALEQRRTALHLMVIMRDPFQQDEQWLRFNQAASDYLEHREAFAAQRLATTEQHALDDLDRLTLRAQALQQRVLQLISDGQHEAALEELFARARPAQENVIKAIRTLNEMQRSGASDALRSTTEANRKALLAMLLVTALAVALSLIVAALVIRRVNQQARRLEAEKRKYQALFEGNMDATLVWERDRLVACNGAARELFSIPANAPPEKIRMDQLIPQQQTDGRDSAQLYQEWVEELQETQSPRRIEWEQCRLDGARFPTEMRLSCVQTENHRLMQMVIRDLTHRKAAEARIQYLAHYDALTDLPNQRLFRDRVETLIPVAARAKRKLAVALLDLDHFKQINDSLGHRQGDALLRIVAERIRPLLDEGDVLARMGGDEFLLLLEDVRSLEHIGQHCDELLHEIALPAGLGGHHLEITASLGISLFPHDADNAEGLIKRADIAMYRAKQAGGGVCRLFAESMNAEVYRHLVIKNSLQRSLEVGDFFLAYQPKMALAGGRIVGMEALVRWQHPSLGLLSPVEFIPIAEENNSICDLSNWIFATAARQTKAWNDTHATALRISVNLSVLQLNTPGLTESVAQILHDTALAPDLLEFEITESVTLEGQDRTLEVLRELKALGVHISIDDFGTGYSSLSYLKKFPVDTLKIDKSFMDDIPADLERTALTRAIIQLAHSLGYAVVAEGVETQEQLEFLAREDCFAMQGFLLSPALKEEDFGRFLSGPLVEGAPPAGVSQNPGPMVMEG